jgi:putative transposase
MAIQTGQKIFCPYEQKIYPGRFGTCPYNNMKYNPDIHHRRSIRLKDYDYSQAGAYFVTICTNNKECLFGDVINGAMQLNEMGIVAQQCWDAIPEHFPKTFLDEFILMPNHMHGIIVINIVGAKNLSPILNDCDSSRAKNLLPLQHRGTSMTIGSIVRGFKIGVTKWARENAATYTPWQRNYYEHIIRSELEMNKIREYITSNPLNWESDENYKN